MRRDRTLSVADEFPQIRPIDSRRDLMSLGEPSGGRRSARLQDIAFDDGIGPTVSIDLMQQEVSDAAAFGNL